MNLYIGEVSPQLFSNYGAFNELVGTTVKIYISDCGLFSLVRKNRVYKKKLKYHEVHILQCPFSAIRKNAKYSVIT